MTLIDFIKAILLTVFSYFAYKKVADKKFPLPQKPLVACVYIALPALTLFLLSQYIVEPLNAVIAVVVHGMVASIVEKASFKQKVFYFGISCSISHILYIVSSVISTIIFVTLFDIQSVNLWLLLSIFVLNTAFMLVIYRVKFKIVVDYNNKITSAGIMIAGITLLLYGILRSDGESSTDFLLPFLGIILSGLGLYWWFKKESVTALNEKQNEVIQTRLKNDIRDSNSQRLELEKALHTEHKRLPAYQEVLETLVSQLENRTARKQAAGILNEFSNSVLIDFSKEITYEKDTQKLPSIGIALVDAIFAYYRGVAEDNGINFGLVADGNVAGITQIITQSQLETLVSNLLDNAIISVRKSGIADGKITARLWSYGLTVNDNGEAFSDSVLADMARCKETLTPNRGDGVGIGFVTIFEITNECKASIEVKQSNEKKSITIRFDGKNRLVIDK